MEAAFAYNFTKILKNIPDYKNGRGEADGLSELPGEPHSPTQYIPCQHYLLLDDRVSHNLAAKHLCQAYRMTGSIVSFS